MSICYRIDDAIKFDIESKKVFIIANEKLAKSGKIGRYYTIFPSFQTFLDNRDDYPHCHEIIVDHQNNKPNISGRLVFDFDISLEVNIPADFKRQVEECVYETFTKYFNNIDDDPEFVWSTCANPKKISKHLTIRNICFDDWIYMSRIFYQLFCIMWDAKYLWIKSSKLVDLQIIRKRASLRMVGSSKIGGCELILDDDKYQLTDSLIRIYLKEKNVQLITKDNINKSIYDSIIPVEEEPPEQIISFNPKATEKPAYLKEVYDKAFTIYTNIGPRVFKAGKISGTCLTLLRTKAGKCLLSKRMHEHENAFLIINKSEDHYSVRFGCYRFCHVKKTMYIGSLSLDNLLIL